MKKSRPGKSVSPTKHRSVGKISDAPLPDYMKPTVSSQMMKHTQNPTSKTGRPLVKKSQRTSFSQVNVNKTCSSILKESRFPKELELSPGGTEYEGTSLKQVCHYTHCSLNGNHSSPTSLQNISLSRKTKKNASRGRLSSFARRGFQTGKMKPDTGQDASDEVKSVLHISDHAKKQSDEYFVQIYTKLNGKTEEFSANERNITNGGEDQATNNKGESGMPWIPFQEKSDNSKLLQSKINTNYSIKSCEDDEDREDNHSDLDIYGMPQFTAYEANYNQVENKDANKSSNLEDFNTWNSSVSELCVEKRASKTVEDFVEIESNESISETAKKEWDEEKTESSDYKSRHGEFLDDVLSLPNNFPDKEATEHQRGKFLQGNNGKENDDIDAKLLRMGFLKNRDVYSPDNDSKYRYMDEEATNITTTLKVSKKQEDEMRFDTEYVVLDAIPEMVETELGNCFREPHSLLETQIPDHKPSKTEDIYQKERSKTELGISKSEHEKEDPFLQCDLASISSYHQRDISHITNSVNSPRSHAKDDELLESTPKPKEEYVVDKGDIIACESTCIQQNVNYDDKDFPVNVLPGTTDILLESIISEKCGILPENSDTDTELENVDESIRRYHFQNMINDFPDIGLSKLGLTEEYIQETDNPTPSVMKSSISKDEAEDTYLRSSNERDCFPDQEKDNSEWANIIVTQEDIKNITESSQKFDVPPLGKDSGIKTGNKYAEEKSKKSEIRRLDLDLVEISQDLAQDSSSKEYLTSEMCIQRENTSFDDQSIISSITCRKPETLESRLSTQYCAKEPNEEINGKYIENARKNTSKCLSSYLPEHKDTHTTNNSDGPRLGSSGQPSSDILLHMSPTNVSDHPESDMVLLEAYTEKDNSILNSLVSLDSKNTNIILKEKTKATDAKPNSIYQTVLGRDIKEVVGDGLYDKSVSIRHSPSDSIVASHEDMNYFTVDDIKMKKNIGVCSIPEVHVPDREFSKSMTDKVNEGFEKTSLDMVITSKKEDKRETTDSSFRSSDVMACMEYGIILGNMKECSGNTDSKFSDGVGSQNIDILPDEPCENLRCNLANEMFNRSSSTITDILDDNLMLKGYVQKENCLSRQINKSSSSPQLCESKTDITSRKITDISKHTANNLIDCDIHAIDVTEVVHGEIQSTMFENENDYASETCLPDDTETKNMNYNEDTRSLKEVQPAYQETTHIFKDANISKAQSIKEMCTMNENQIPEEFLFKDDLVIKQMASSYVDTNIKIDSGEHFTGYRSVGEDVSVYTLGDCSDFSHKKEESNISFLRISHSNVFEQNMQPSPLEYLRFDLASEASNRSSPTTLNTDILDENLKINESNSLKGCGQEYSIPSKINKTFSSSPFHGSKTDITFQQITAVSNNPINNPTGCTIKAIDVKEGPYGETESTQTGNENDVASEPYLMNYTDTNNANITGYTQRLQEVQPTNRETCKENCRADNVQENNLFRQDHVIEHNESSTIDKNTKEDNGEFFDYRSLCEDMSTHKLSDCPHEKQIDKGSLGNGKWPHENQAEHRAPINPEIGISSTDLVDTSCTTNELRGVDENNHVNNAGPAGYELETKRSQYFSFKTTSYQERKDGDDSHLTVNMGKGNVCEGLPSLDEDKVSQKESREIMKKAEKENGATVELEIPNTLCDDSKNEEKGSSLEQYTRTSSKQTVDGSRKDSKNIIEATQTGKDTIMLQMPLDKDSGRSVELHKLESLGRYLQVVNANMNNDAEDEYSLPENERINQGPKRTEDVTMTKSNKKALETELSIHSEARKLSGKILEETMTSIMRTKSFEHYKEYEMESLEERTKDVISSIELDENFDRFGIKKDIAYEEKVEMKEDNALLCINREIDVTKYDSIKYDYSIDQDKVESNANLQNISHITRKYDGNDFENTSSLLQLKFPDRSSKQSVMDIKESEFKQELDNEVVLLDQAILFSSLPSDIMNTLNDQPSICDLEDTKPLENLLQKPNEYFTAVDQGEIPNADSLGMPARNDPCLVLQSQVPNNVLERTDIISSKLAFSNSEKDSRSDKTRETIDPKLEHAFSKICELEDTKSLENLLEERNEHFTTDQGEIRNADNLGMPARNDPCLVLQLHESKCLEKSQVSNDILERTDKISNKLAFLNSEKYSCAEETRENIDSKPGVLSNIVRETGVKEVEDRTSGVLENETKEKEVIYEENMDNVLVLKYIKTVTKNNLLEMNSLQDSKISKQGCTRATKSVPQKYIREENLKSEIRVPTGERMRMGIFSSHRQSDANVSWRGLETDQLEGYDVPSETQQLKNKNLEETEVSKVRQDIPEVKILKENADEDTKYDDEIHGLKYVEPDSTENMIRNDSHEYVVLLDINSDENSVGKVEDGRNILQIDVGFDEEGQNIIEEDGSKGKMKTGMSFKYDEMEFTRLIKDICGRHTNGEPETNIAEEKDMSTKYNSHESEETSADKGGSLKLDDEGILGNLQEDGVECVMGEDYFTTSFKHLGKIICFTSVATSDDQPFPETIKKLKATSSKRKIEFKEDFNNLGTPSRGAAKFVQTESEPEAEEIQLRHQDIDERKEAEKWMIDYALRQLIARLAPSRKRKVALLVEAYEAVLPPPQNEELTDTDMLITRPLQTCG